MRLRARVVTRLVALFAAALFGGPAQALAQPPAPAPQPPPAAQQPAPSQEAPPARIKVAVDVVAVDVQVIDRTGQPVPNLGPEKFTVTINGKRRRVISAEQIGSESGDARAMPAPGSAAAAVPAA